MKLTPNENGTFDLTEISQDDLHSLFYGVHEYQAVLSRERKEERIGGVRTVGGVPAGPEDLKFLDETLVRVTRTMDTFEDEIVNNEIRHML